MVRTPGIFQFPSAASSARPEVNVMTANCPASRKSAERIRSSRLGWPEETLDTSMETLTVADSGSPSGTFTSPLTAENRPVTRATVMCRTENSTMVCAASMVQAPGASGAVVMAGTSFRGRVDRSAAGDVGGGDAAGSLDGAAEPGHHLVDEPAQARRRQGRVELAVDEDQRHVVDAGRLVLGDRLGHGAGTAHDHRLVQE